MLLVIFLVDVDVKRGLPAQWFVDFQRQGWQMITTMLLPQTLPIQDGEPAA